ncbi:MAG: phosphatase PAP2 family protein [Paludibacteraceae bacterium]|nr:phosphatase PAP2 family protein [Paludibacteraceae bacterium]
MRYTICFLCLLVGTISVSAKDVKTYVTKKEIPDATFYLPAPPDSLYELMAGDYGRYWWGKSLRNTPRGERAREDAKCNADYFCTIFSEAMGITLSKDNTPEIYELLNRAVQTIDLGDRGTKKHYQRRRPYMVFSEPTLVPEDEEHLSKNGSYPSGHTVCGWSTALLLTEINPTAATEILRIGYEYGQSRVIAGFHWQSDVDAGRAVAAAGYAYLHSNEEFLAQMQKAKQEFKRLTNTK